MLEIYNLDNEREWRRNVELTNNYDFYHTYDYHKLAKQNGEGDPKLFVYRQDDEIILLPLLERFVDDKGEFRDYTSAYGYVGPLYHGHTHSRSCIEGFQKEFNNYLLKNNVVSVFSRLHPLIEQKSILKNLGTIDLLSKTVTIELNESLEEQRRKYRKSNKSEINKLRRSARCKVANTTEEIDLYISIYIENMKRIDASRNYFFNRDYFFDLINASDFTTEIVLAYENDIVMAGAMFIYTNKIVQYHLAGTLEKYLSRTPMKLILDEVRIQATEKGFDYFHLGGGVASKEDSLYKFKSGFSDRYDQFKVWKYIVNPDVYNELVKTKEVRISDYNYFPLYRG